MRHTTWAQFLSLCPQKDMVSCHPCRKHWFRNAVEAKTAATATWTTSLAYVRTINAKAGCVRSSVMYFEMRRSRPSHQTLRAGYHPQRACGDSASTPSYPLESSLPFTTISTWRQSSQLLDAAPHLLCSAPLTTCRVETCISPG
jgi:hypothetical protein